MPEVIDVAFLSASRRYDEVRVDVPYNDDKAQKN